MKKFKSLLNMYNYYQSQEYVEEFRKACEKYTKKACKSKKSAQKALIEMGIYNKNGTLNENYK